MKSSEEQNPNLGNDDIYAISRSLAEDVRLVTNAPNHLDVQQEQDEQK